ncbi:TetR/AcrR family transcriptional regulator [Sphaerothrix gracilis]|uniref:TetR/AcrR family transcriptional regulator n=1 Tax=Sphaerothrix gracilis TaxID=3151835 RepID=UPI0031FDC839
MSSATTADTKTQILDVAERLIAEKGFAGTTLRNIVSAAKVNLAAVHYHFGSKEELFRAVVRRIAVPVTKRQLKLLKQLQEKTATASVEALLTAFLTPPLEFIGGDDNHRIVRAQFMGRCRTEPEPIQNIAYQEFSVSTEPFLDALQRALPEQSRSQIHWKLDLVVAALIRVQMEAGKPNALLQSSQSQDIQATISKLATFLAAGMYQ